MPIGTGFRTQRSAVDHDRDVNARGLGIDSCDMHGGLLVAVAPEPEPHGVAVHAPARHHLQGEHEWVTSRDMIQYSVDLPWRDPPGEVFHHKTAGTHLLAVVVAEATGSPLLDFARQRLFGPLGIQDVVWWTDERGYYTGGMGLFLHPRDMVKLGELVLREGTWQGHTWHSAGVQWSGILNLVVNGVLPAVRD